MDNQEKNLDRTQINKYFSALGLLVLGSVYIPLAADGTVPVASFASIVSIICFVLLFVGGKKISRIFPIALIYFAVYALTGSAVIGSILIALFTSVSLAANELASPERRKWQAALLYVSLPLSALLAYFLTKNIYIMIFGALPYALFTVLGVCARKRVNRKRAIIMLTAVFVLFGLIVAGVYMLLTKTDIYGLRQSYVGLRDGFIYKITSFSVDMNGETVKLFEDPALVSELILSATNILPAVLVAALVILSYFMYNYQMSMMARFYGDEYLSDDIMKIDISAAAAAVYLIAFVFSFTTDSYGGTPFGSVVCQNIYMILAPALVYTGFVSARNFFKKKNIRVGILILLPLLLLAMTGYLFMILAFIGILCVLGRRARAWADGKE